MTPRCSCSSEVDYSNIVVDFDDLKRQLSSVPGFRSMYAVRCAPDWVIIQWDANKPIPGLPLRVRYAGPETRPVLVRVGTSDALERLFSDKSDPLATKQMDYIKKFVDYLSPYAGYPGTGGHIGTGFGKECEGCSRFRPTAIWLPFKPIPPMADGVLVQINSGLIG